MPRLGELGFTVQTGVVLMDDFLLEKISTLLKIQIFLKREDVFIPFRKTDIPNPLKMDSGLAARIIDGSGGQEEPFIYVDEYQVYFAGIRERSDIYLIGPMAGRFLDFGKRRSFYRRYGYKGSEDLEVHTYSISQILNFVESAARIIKGIAYTDTQLIKANNLENVFDEKESIRFDIQSEDEDIYRHSYVEEKELLEEVRNGNAEAALERTWAMDTEIGKLGQSSVEHWRNMLVVSATLCARAAIEGGLPPYVAYRVSGFYINEGSGTDDIARIMKCRDQAVQELSDLVAKEHKRIHTGSYTRKCKDYVMKHYREKILLSTVAGELGISESYLSRLFKKETGQNISEYIIEVRVERAANLLRYSEESIPRIAEYVHFPSQSYFGKVFKKLRHMTPREYREKYKPLEFNEK